MPRPRRRFLRVALSISLCASFVWLPSANAIMDGRIVQASGRVVPIFVLPSDSAQQPTAAAAFTGFLYSSRIVFTAASEIDFDANGKQFLKNFPSIYVGKPGSDVGDINGRVKVVKRYYSSKYRNENGKLDEFAVFVLEKDLINATPFPLLDSSIEKQLARTANVTGYGEFRDQCAQGQKLPCRDTKYEGSSKPRTVTVTRMYLPEIESIVGYKRPQLANQLIFYNQANPRAGAICFGDSGAPIIGEYRFKQIYLGQMSNAMRIYGCGRGEDYDGKSGIHYASPVYRHFDLIRAAEAFVAADKKAASNSAANPQITLPSGSVSISLKTSTSDSHDNEQVAITYRTNSSESPSPPTGFRFFNGYKKDLIQVAQIPLSQAKCLQRSNTELFCTFPTFNPYQNIRVKGTGVALQAAAYNQRGQGALSEASVLHELMWQSKFASIDFVDLNQVIEKIFSPSAANFLGFRSRTATTQIRATFIFEGTRLKSPLPKPKIVLEETKYDTRSEPRIINHKMRFEGYKYENQRHLFEFVSEEKVNFAGDSFFNASVDVSDRDGFVRARSSTSFTFGYNMKLQCSTDLLLLQSFRDSLRINIKAASVAFTALNDFREFVLPFEKRDLPVWRIFLSKYFDVDPLDPTLITDIGLSVIETIVREDKVEFNIILRDGVLPQLKSRAGDVAISTVVEKSGLQTARVGQYFYRLEMTKREAEIFYRDYFMAINEWGTKNGEKIFQVCGKSG